MILLQKRNEPYFNIKFKYFRDQKFNIRVKKINNNIESTLFT